MGRLGLARRLRRGKAAVAKKYKPDRLAYARWVLRQPSASLRRWAYIDGTSFFLARTPEEHEGKERAALGRYCYRMKTGEGSLEDKNVGPPAYSKAQGLPIKIWGFFCDGILRYYVLPSPRTEKGALTTEHMNGTRYEAMVKANFAKWRRGCIRGGRVFVAKDYERFLRKPSIIAAEEAAGCDQIAEYPKSSPDLNAIEGWWRTLRLRLTETEPAAMETRSEFLRRLRRAVAYLNTNCRQHGRKLCRNQKVRARECLALKGARTRW